MDGRFHHFEQVTVKKSDKNYEKKNIIGWWLFKNLD